MTSGGEFFKAGVRCTVKSCCRASKPIARQDTSGTLSTKYHSTNVINFLCPAYWVSVSECDWRKDSIEASCLTSWALRSFPWSTCLMIPQSWSHSWHFPSFCYSIISALLEVWLIELPPHSITFPAPWLETSSAGRATCIGGSLEATIWSRTSWLISLP